MNLLPIGPNQTQISSVHGKRRLFFSYCTPVAAEIDGTYYRTSTKHSVTTNKHISAWLGGSPAEEKPQAWFDALKI